jgi:hypothetical protein
MSYFFSTSGHRLPNISVIFDISAAIFLEGPFAKITSLSLPFIFFVKFAPLSGSAFFKASD